MCKEDFNLSAVGTILGGASVARYMFRDVILPQTALNAQHDYRRVFLKCREDIDGMDVVDIPASRVLILGCGFHYPDVVLWSKVAGSVVGIDVRRSYLRNGFFRILTGGNSEATERSPLSIAFELYDWYKHLGYYRELRGSSSLALDEFHQDLVCYDGVRFPFTDGSFDIVISNAVLEHVGNLDKLVEETSRITSSSGICYHLWHNYCSISGAHVPERLASEYPWGHLTGNRKVESHMKFMGNIVNKKSPYEIKGSLEVRFRPMHFFSVDGNHNKRGVDSEFSYEGEELLTEGLSSLLSSYPRDTLLTRGYLFIGRKKETSSAYSTSTQ